MCNIILILNSTTGDIQLMSIFIGGEKMSDGWLDNTHSWLWYMVHSNVKFFTVQKVVNEKELADNLKKGWIMVTQLKSGEIVVEMQFNISQVLERGMAQIRSETKI